MFRLRAGVRAVRRFSRQREGRRTQRGGVQEDRQSARLGPRLYTFEAAGASRHQTGKCIGVRAGYDEDQAVRLWLHEARGHAGKQDTLHLGAVSTARDPRGRQERAIRLQEELGLLAIRHRSLRLPHRESAVAERRSHSGSGLLGFPAMAEETYHENPADIQTIHSQAAQILSARVRAQAGKEAARDRDQQILQGLVVHQQDQPQRHIDVGRRERELSPAWRQLALPRHYLGRPTSCGREQEQAEKVT